MRKFLQSARPYIPYMLALVPVMTFRELTPQNELRYLTIVDEALRDHHFWSFTFEGSAYADKPPLYFWLLMAARWILGSHIPLVINMFSLIPAIGILMIFKRWTERFAPSYLKGGMADWMLATCGLQLGMAVFARMDMLMSLFVAWCMYIFWKRTHTDDAGRTDARLSWQMGTMLFLALFSKGPLGILIPLMSITVFMALDGRLSEWLRVWNWRVWLPIVAGCAVWWSAAWRESGTEYVNNMLFHQTVDRAVDAFHHQRPWWFYLKTIWYTTLPWGPFCIVVMLISLVKRTWNKEPLQKFFTTTFLSTFVMLSFISGKLDVYLLPAYPFLVYGSMLQFSQWQVAGKVAPAVVKTCKALMCVIFAAGLCLPLAYKFLNTP